MTTPSKSGIKGLVQAVKFKHGVAETVRGLPIDLAKMGRISVRRSSEILFNEEEQKYYIHWLEPRLSHENETWAKWPNMFDTYESAVKTEVYVLNRRRIAGQI